MAECVEDWLLKKGRDMALTNEQLLLLYQNLVKVRRMDEWIVKAMQEGKILGFYHSCQGMEAAGIGSCTFLRDDDILHTHHRGHGLAYFISKGGSGKAFLAEHYGRTTGMSGGLAGFHCVDTGHGIFGKPGTVGAQFSVAIGSGLACKKRGRGQVAVLSFGDGASNRGQIHEALNLSSLWKLPVIYVCENNLYAVSMPIGEAYAREDIADLAVGYDMPGIVVDGQDVMAVQEAVGAAVERARAGEGPSLLECKTYRYRAHSEGSRDTVHSEPRPREEIEAWKKRDPIKLCREQLLGQGVLSAGDVERIDAEVDAWVAEAEKFAMESPVPGPEILELGIYAD